jgi:hypothetical protein
MKKSKRTTVIGAVVACALMLLLQAEPAQAQNTESGDATRYRVRSLRGGRQRAATVRNKANGFVLGTLFSTDAFDVQYRAGSYAWGYAHGNAQRCGWVLLSAIERVDKSRGRRRRLCGPPREINFSEFGSSKNSITCPNGKQSRADGSGTRINGAAPFYRNYNGRPVGTPITLSDKQLVFWRYVTKDGRFVLLRLKNETWGFVPIGNVPSRPVDTSCP